MSLARIGLQLSDGSVLSAYHHWDDYPGGWDVSSKQTVPAEAVSELIDGGDMGVCR